MPARRLPVRSRRFAIVIVALAMLIAHSLAWRAAGQSSPARGTAQVIAQGLTAPPADKVAWRIIRQPIPERIDARPSNRMQASAGFLLADDTAIFVADQRTKLRTRLSPGEAQFVPSGANQTWASLERTRVRPGHWSWSIRRSPRSARMATCSIEAALFRCNLAITTWI